MRRFLERLIPFLGVAVFAVALGVLYRELSDDTWSAAREGFAAVSPGPVALAVLLTAASFFVLGFYDRLGVRYAGRSLATARTSLASMLGYAFSHSLGFPLFSGAPVRYRLYSAWGLSVEEVARVVAFGHLTAWLGFLGLGGTVYLLGAGAVPAGLPALLADPRPLGAGLLLALAGLLVASRVLVKPVRVAGIEFPVPPPRALLGQTALGALDWTLAAAVLFVLLPPGHGIGFVPFLGLFLLAQAAGMVSRVPGGLGVVEAVLVLLLPEAVIDGHLLASLLAWRAIYHLLPLFVAVALLGAWEFRARSRAVGMTVGALGRGLTSATPVLLAGGTFAAGVLLLLYGAIPTPPGHLVFLEGFLPGAAFALSHLLASLAGAGLMVLAWGLARRLDGAYHLTLVLLAAGVALSLLRGGELLPAVTMAVLLLALLPARREFFRESSLTAEPLAPGWVALIVGVLVATAWLGTVAHGEIALSSEVWWDVTLRGDAPRFLRAMTGAVALLVVFGAVRLVRPAVPRALIRPAGSVGPEIAAAVDRSERASAALAFTGDKSFLLSKSHRSFVMYGVAAGTWVSLGDPVGDPEEMEELVWRFRKLAFQYGGRPAFYGVRPAGLPTYLDAGLALLKLGEDARVPLETFSLEGGRWKDFRQTLNRAEREGTSFELLPAGAADANMGELREVSDLWLASRNAREKSFSLGRFDEAYLARTPLGIARSGGRIVGFVNVLAPARKEELSADLMRYRPDAMKGVMEFLFAHLMLWGKAQGYRSFSMGMAPLSGLEAGRLAPLWPRLGAAVFRHGEHFYNFQGLRAYKEKFNPVWEPRYLACPGGLALPRILASIGALIGGGVGGLIRR